MVRALFTVAECLQPSVIFIDEIDSILSARISEGEHESSRRLKTEILTQMEGVDTGDRRVVLVAATNRPDELDEAARRRLPKQLYIPLPCPNARKAMLERELGESSVIALELSSAEMNQVVEKTAGYSGSDMRAVVQEAAQIALKAVKASVETGEVTRYESYDAKHGGALCRRCCWRQCHVR